MLRAAPSAQQSLSRFNSSRELIARSRLIGARAAASDTMATEVLSKGSTQPELGTFDAPTFITVRHWGNSSIISVRRSFASSHAQSHYNESHGEIMCRL
jgi:hypothetical protein